MLIDLEPSLEVSGGWGGTGEGMLGGIGFRVEGGWGGLENIRGCRNHRVWGWDSRLRLELRDGSEKDF